MKPLCCIVALATGLLGAASAEAVIVHGDMDGQTGDPTGALASPGDGGWAFVGSYRGSSGVAIGPHHFIATQHQSNASLGHFFELDGASYETIGVTDIAGSDLRVYEVDGTLPVYAELYTGAITGGTSATLVGYGINSLGDAVTTGNPPPNDHGWEWGTTRGKSWGVNTIDGTATNGDGDQLLWFDFDGQAGQGIVANNDSGGGLFIYDAGQWKLAGVHHAVQGPYSYTSGGEAFGAAIYQGDQLYVRTGDKPDDYTWIDAPSGPQRGYSSNIPHYADAIYAAIPEPAALSVAAVAAPLLLRRRRTHG